MRFVCSTNRCALCDSRPDPAGDKGLGFRVIGVGGGVGEEGRGGVGGGVPRPVAGGPPRKKAPSSPPCHTFWGAREVSPPKPIQQGSADFLLTPEPQTPNPKPLELWPGLQWRERSAGALQSKPEPVKPASHESDCRSLAALLALRATRREQFGDISGCWVGQLLEQGKVYKEKTTGKFFISLGFNFKAGLGWYLEEVEEGYLSLAPLVVAGDSCGDRLFAFVTAHVHENESFRGVPIKVCPSAAFLHRCSTVRVSFVCHRLALLH